MLPNLWRPQKENISSQRQIRMCLWWGGWWWWLTIQSTQTSSCWLTPRKEIHTSFKPAAGWMQCCGLNTWVRPARATNSRFLQTWWLLSKSWRKRRCTVVPAWSKDLLRAPAAPYRARKSPQAPAQPLELRTKSTNFREWSEIFPENKLELQNKLPWTTLLSPNWPVETTALTEWEETNTKQCAWGFRWCWAWNTL